MPTTTEMSTVLEATNPTGRKGRPSPRLPCVTCHTLGALHTAGFVVNKRGTLLRFEKWWHIADGAIRRYRKAGLLWWRVAPT